MNQKEFYSAKIDKIAKESFNAEQKAIAKKIIATTDEKDLDAVWGLISQRVKIGFTFDEAPEVNHNAVAVVKENEKLFIPSVAENAIEHKLIIGENYDALKNLLVTYTDNQGKGLIDVIYIDPPYNTEKTKDDGNDYKGEVEATKFIYRDKFTRDGWLNMMNERLKLAKKLLNENGVIFISIDDSMQAYLKVLCDEIFGEGNFEGHIHWRRRHNQPNDKTKLIGLVAEHILVFAKNSYALKLFGVGKVPLTGDFSNPDNDPRGDWNSKPWKVGSGQSGSKYEITKPNGETVSGEWMGEKSTFKALLADNRIVFPRNGSGEIRKKIFKFEREQEGQSAINWWSHELFGSNQDATDEMKKIFTVDNVFDNPKPTSLVKRIIGLGSTKSDAVILDFFAGSGTTGQAVMELNAEDGGTRKFILVTNNENDIATKVTRERLYRVINGKGSKGEKIDWEYSKDKKTLTGNAVRVFDIKTESLTIADIDKAEKIKAEAEKDFKKLNEKYKTKNELDIYTQLASLNPQKSEK